MAEDGIRYISVTGFVIFFFFFFKQKTAYEIYQCDWSSDVCSSDLSTYYWSTKPIPSGERRESSESCAKRERHASRVPDLQSSSHLGCC